VSGTDQGNPSYSFGDWTVEPAVNRLSRGQTTEQVERLTMDVLTYLLERPGQVVSSDEFLSALWGDRHGDPGMIQKRIAQLRQVLGDDSRQPRYIETVRTRGYRTVAPVGPTGHHTTSGGQGAARLRTHALPALGVLVALAVAALWLWQGNGAGPAPATPAAAGSAPLSSIAVLPFDDLSPGADHGWLAAGLAEDLIEALRRIEGLRVPARRSTSLAKASGFDLARIGERLEVGSAVEGSVRRLDDQLSVVVRWVRIDDGSRLWSARFDRRFEDVFELQKDIATGIAEAIRTELGIQDVPASLFDLRYSTKDLRAWELLKKATALTETFDRAKLPAARAMLLQATEYDPSLDAARVLLAFIDYLTEVDEGIDGFRTVLAADPSHPLALGLFAWDSFSRFWDYDSAERLLDRIPMADRTAAIHETAFHIYANTGRLDQALSAATRAVRLDPLWARGHCMVGYIHDWRGDGQAAMPAYERAMAVHRETGQFGVWCNGRLARLYHQVGRDSEVIPTILDSGLWDAYIEPIRRGWAEGGWQGLNLAWANALIARDGRRENMALLRSPYACPYWHLAFAGEVDRMFDCLGEELEATEVGDTAASFRQALRRQLLAQFRVSTELQQLREDPRTLEFKRRIQERMEAAAGTYAQQVGLPITP